MRSSLVHDSFLLWLLVASPDKEPVFVRAQLFVDRGGYLEALKAVTARALTEKVVRAGHNLKPGVEVADPLVDLAHEQPLFKFVADHSTFRVDRTVFLADKDRSVQLSVKLRRMAVTETVEADGRGEPSARERILDSAYELFSRRGIRDVGVDEVIDRATVAKATLYRHFPSKDDLVLAFLQRREQLWTKDFIEAEARRRGSTPEEQLLAIFDVFDEWFRRDDFEACSFINVLLEMGSAHCAGVASVRHLENIRSVVRSLAEEAGLRDLDSFARSWHILMKGSIVSAAEGDAEAAQRAKSMARLLIDQHSQ